VKIRELFEYNVTRDIPPVVYFHEQSPDKLDAEVREYIITGGWKPDHPNHERVKRGIHEHYVALLRRIVELLDTPGGPELPASWISGFYGSGKSSFAKLLGLSLDDAKLPDGSKLSDAWLARDKSQKTAELRDAWLALTRKIEPIAVVFDIGGISRGDEHIHTAVVRQVQARLGYCDTSPLVANYELKLERDGNYPAFLATFERTLGKPWSEFRSTHMVEDHFSAVLHAQFPELYHEPTDWLSARDGQALDALSAEDAARAIADMLTRRAPSKTLFIVIDEVSQYISQDDKRMLALQSLVSALGQRLKGKAWLFATGQQQLDDQNDASVLNKMKDRFPASLRVHLDATSIRDVVHRRLLQKREDQLPALRELFAKHRSNLSLFAYGCDSISEDDFVEVYPLLPQHINLILRMTSALRTRSSRAQSDHHAIRGLLQMLGELFRTQRAALTDAELGVLITIDQIYEIQGSALDVDAQNTMARILEFCANDPTSINKLAVRCAKAVALLELIQADEDGKATDVDLVARCLYANVGDGDNKQPVREALTLLLDANLLSYDEKTGYKLQSSAGQEWEGERQDISVPAEDLAELVMDTLRVLVADSKPAPHLGQRPFPWQGLFSTENTHHEHKFVGGREDTVTIVDFRLLPSDRQNPIDWTNRSSESALRDRIIWIGGAYQSVMDKARQIGKSKRIVARYSATRAALTDARRRLLGEEEVRLGSQLDAFKKTVGEAFMAGRLYFRGADTDPNDYGASFLVALAKAGSTRLPTIYSHFIDTNVTNGELEQLLQRDLSGPSVKFYADDLGILATDAGRIVPTCEGTVPRRVLELIQRDTGISGQGMLRHFSEPPYGYTTNVIKACVAGLLRARKVYMRIGDAPEVTSIVDPGVQDLFRRDRDFKQAEVYPVVGGDISPTIRAKIAELFKDVFHTPIEPENDEIADTLDRIIQPKQRELWEVETRLNLLPGSPPTPEALTKLHRAFEDCLRSRQVKPRVLAVAKNLEVLRDGVSRLNAYRSELSDEAVEAVRTAKTLADTQLRQLIEAGDLDAALQDAERRIGEQLRSGKPWLGIDAIEPDLEAVRVAYRERRLGLLGTQEQMAESMREQVKRIPGFDKLGPAQHNTALRPIRLALRETTEHQTHPSLAGLLDGLEQRLDAARESARIVIDEFAEKETGVPIVGFSIDVRDRVITSAQDVDTLLDEIRTRLLAQLDHEGRKVHLRLS
jgi:Family of unknown function (DUF6079)